MIFEAKFTEANHTLNGEFGEVSYLPNNLAWTKGFQEGQQAEYDRFWDEFQENGERASYTYAFYGSNGWTDETYNPKYEIAPLTCNQMFNANTKITDTKVTINLTGANANITSLFANCSNLVTIRKLIVKESNKLSGSFGNCKALKNIVFEGTIGRDINLQWCPLTVESMLSIVNHLKDYTNTEYSGTYMLTLSADCWNRLEAYYAENQFDFAVGGSGFADIYPTMKEYIQYALGWAIG
jgi:hypothetical protein